eukprot:scaffold196043_cov19-Tisochrysis_lutea.AAC.1
MAHLCTHLAHKGHIRKNSNIADKSTGNLCHVNMATKVSRPADTGRPFKVTVLITSRAELQHVKANSPFL